MSEAPSFVCNLKLKTNNIKRLESLVSLLQWCRDPDSEVWEGECNGDQLVEIAVQIQ